MDKQNRFVKWSSAGVVLLLGTSGMLLAGCNHGAEETIQATPAQATVPPGTKKPGMGGPAGMMPGRPGAPGKMPGKRPRATAPGATPGSAPVKRDPFAPATAAPAGAPGAAKTPPPPVVLSRKGFDPFYVTWKTPLPPPNVFEEIQPMRVASPSFEAPPEEPIVVREVADRRVSGIMSGDGVFAIIEQNGNSEVVKPGGTTSDGYRVISIADDTVKLQKKEGNVIRTQVVQLSDIQTGGPSQSFNRPGNFGGMSGGFPGGGFNGGGRFPGRPGGGRPGGGNKGE